MSAKDRLAEKLMSMKKTKFKNTKSTTNDGIKAPRAKSNRTERSPLQFRGSLGTKGGGGTVSYEGKNGAKVGVSTGGGYKSKGKDLVKAGSAFAHIPISDKVSVNIGGKMNAPVTNRTRKRGDRARGGSDMQKSVKAKVNYDIGGSGVSKGEEKLRREKQAKREKDL